MATWSEKLSSSKVAQKKLLDKSVSGMPAGALMYISTPQEIDQYINSVPFGNSKTIQQMRDELAKNNQADCTCPLTTGIFLRIVSHAAFEKSQSHNKLLQRKNPLNAAPGDQVVLPARRWSGV